MTEEQTKKLEDFLESEKINVTGWYLKNNKTRVMEISDCISAKQIKIIFEILEMEEIQMCAMEGRNDSMVIALAWKEK